jgi:hypothetical protein
MRTSVCSEIAIERARSGALQTSDVKLHHSTRWLKESFGFLGRCRTTSSAGVSLYGTLANTVSLRGECAYISIRVWTSVGAGVTREVVRVAAQRLLERYGNDAYDRACVAVRLAMRRRNVRMSAFLAAVAGEVARRTGCEEGIRLSRHHAPFHGSARSPSTPFHPRGRDERESDG